MVSLFQHLPHRLLGSCTMERLLRPATVALVGASTNPRSLGGRTLANLSSFPGRLYLVNPHQQEIGGRPCYPDVTSLPEPMDCVVLAIPAQGVEEVVRQCVSAQAGAVVVLASGYRETDTPEGIVAQERLVALAGQAGVRVVGPNCVGVCNHVHGLNAAFAEFPRSELRPGSRIGLVSQSGALALGLAQAAERGVCFSHILTCGNSCDVDIADFVAFLAQDPHCDAIALTFEGCDDRGRLQRALAIASAEGKRVALCKLGTSTAGRAAIRHHTGTDPGDLQQLDLLCRTPGVVMVERIEALVETAAFLAKVPEPVSRGDLGVAVLTGSGGTGILAVDAAARAGVPTPQPQPQTAQRLAAALPHFASPRNPCDVTAQATRDPQSMLDCADALLEDPDYGALVLPWGRSQTPALLPQLGALGVRYGKPVCVVWMSQSLQSPATDAAERDSSLCLFRSLDHCFAALAAWSTNSPRSLSGFHAYRAGVAPETMVTALNQPPSP
jgi:acyl-CoA synthetase (NDP forming)